VDKNNRKMGIVVDKNNRKMGIGVIVRDHMGEVLSTFIKECIVKEEVQLKFVKTHDQVADIFTKLLKNKVFSKLRALIGVNGN
jgi:hypothetical protein